MRNKILKLAFRFSAFAFAVGMTGCDALDLAPIDTMEAVTSGQEKNM
jgi:lipoprotein